jgi:DNA helicase-2/ATP-dependent DNA helicase PcrA
MDALDPSSLNAAQRAAVEADDTPLLIIAGAGTGKTHTLACRVAHLIGRGADPGRIMLLTFTRRAAAEMIRRVQGMLPGAAGRMAGRIWGGTFHAVGTRLLRLYGRALGLGEAFSILDRSDAEDLLNLVRGELRLEESTRRFPRKETCLAIYSRCVNAGESVEQALRLFPWCAGSEAALKQLFRQYTAAKQAQYILDYDDLLLYWRGLMQDGALAADIRGRFDHVLVDEYQDTNALQAQIVQGLRPDGRGLTVVGDDAQAIYAFRAATIGNILDFGRTFPGARVVTLEQNYRSTQPILDVANAVIAAAPRRYEKRLTSTRTSQARPRLVTLVDEQAQAMYVADRILRHREAGIPLQRQAVLFRAVHHSDVLEIELNRRNIPFVKYGGLKFLEAAHIKDALAILRLAENLRDRMTGLRVLLLLDGFGPATARRALDHLAAGGFDLACLQNFVAPPAAEQWRPLLDLLRTLRREPSPAPAEQLALVRAFYAPIVTHRHEQPALRLRDLEQLERLAGQYTDRAALLADLTLDPPAGTQDLAGPPLRDEDYVILSTMHSAKGCQWDAVYIIHAADGNIPSDMATGTPAEVEEERRLVYVALTRARDQLEVCFPLRYYHRKHATGDAHTYAQLTRFLPREVAVLFEAVGSLPTARGRDAPTPALASDIRRQVAAMWD